MPYDPDLLERARKHLAGTAELEEKRMFGGIAFMVRGNMACGLMSDGGFMVRVHPDRTEETVGPHAKVMVQGGREMRGFILVDPGGVAEDDALADWIDLSLAHSATLPTKTAKTPRKKARKG